MFNDLYVKNKCSRSGLSPCKWWWSILMSQYKTVRTTERQEVCKLRFWIGIDISQSNCSSSNATYTSANRVRYNLGQGDAIWHWAGLHGVDHGNRKERAGCSNHVNIRQRIRIGFQNTSFGAEHLEVCLFLTYNYLRNCTLRLNKCVKNFESKRKMHPRI